ATHAEKSTVASGRMNAVAAVIVAMWRKAVRTAEGDLRALTFLRDCGRHGDAATLLPTIFADVPVAARITAIAGEIMLALGQFDQARSHFREALASEPDSAAGWLRLAHSQRFSESDAVDLRRLESANRRTDLSDDTQVCVGFGLGKAYDDLGDSERAVRMLSAANARWHRRQPWNRDLWLRFIDQRLCAPRASAGVVQSTFMPVFVLGLPRTGTTLVASLLARDARVRNRGELNWIAAFAARLASDERPGLRDAAARMFLTQLRQDDAQAQAYIDKNPLNFLHIDLIAELFPNARIVHCRRDPRDTALSLWSAHFMHADMSWSYDFADISAYNEGYARLMQHWTEQSLLPIHDVDYEYLVRQPEIELQRLRDFIGLGGDIEAADAQLVANDAITTASVWQARQQIHSRSVGRWQRYAPLLAPLAAVGDRVSASIKRPA
ncbi:MAG: sulfotransferase, partial [Dokdonella sp.]